jgi:hypothetical protein
MGRVSAFLSVRLGDQFRLLLAAALLLALPVVFFVGTFAQIRRRLVRLSERVARFVPGTPTYTRVVSAVKVADSRFPGNRKCLTRSSAAEVLLRLYGFAPDHRIGVAKEDDGEIEAHSWLEFDDDVIIGDLEDLGRFDPLPSLDAADAV